MGLSRGGSIPLIRTSTRFLVLVTNILYKNASECLPGAVIVYTIDNLLKMVYI